VGVSPASVTSVEGAGFTNQTVATVAVGDTSTLASQFSASIDWGDGGAIDTGTISGPQGGPFTITGSHSYADEGSYSATVQVTDLTLPADGGTADSPVTVTDAAINGAALSFNATTGASTGTIPVAMFTDTNPGAAAADFSASIDWGDSSTSAGTIIGPLGGPFAVSAAHTYASQGTFPVVVSIVDDGGSTTAPATTASVSDAVIPCAPNQPCSGTAAVPNQQAITVSGTSTTTGTVFVVIGQDTLSCGDPFLHAPQVTTLTETGFTSANGKQVSLDINKSVVGKNGSSAFRVCYSSPNPFTDLYGHKNVTTGLLPYCSTDGDGDSPQHNSVPCVTQQVKNSAGDVIENFTVPAGDPKFH